MPELRLPVTAELLATIKAHHARRMDCPSLPAMAREYILRTIKEVERADLDLERKQRQERARLARLERRASEDRADAARAERARARAERRAERASVPTWNAPLPERAGPDAPAPTPPPTT